MQTQGCIISDSKQAVVSDGWFVMLRAVRPMGAKHEMSSQSSRQQAIGVCWATAVFGMHGSSRSECVLYIAVNGTS